MAAPIVPAPERATYPGTRRLVAAGSIRSGKRRIVITPELVELPPLPTQPRARRTVTATRGW